MPPLLTAFAPPTRAAAPQSTAQAAGTAAGTAAVATVRLEDVMAMVRADPGPYNSNPSPILTLALALTLTLNRWSAWQG